MDLADGLEIGSPFLCLHSLDLAVYLRVWKPALRSIPPLSESSLLQLSFSEEIDIVCI